MQWAIELLRLKVFWKSAQRTIVHLHQWATWTLTYFGSSSSTISYRRYLRRVVLYLKILQTSFRTLKGSDAPFGVLSWYIIHWSDFQVFPVGKDNFFARTKTRFWSYGGHKTTEAIVSVLGDGFGCGGRDAATALWCWRRRRWGSVEEE